MVLLPKDPLTMAVSSFRPICLISILCKIYECLIKNRLDEELSKLDELSKKQFGFVKGKSTTHPAKETVNMVKASKAKWVALIALDVKNAFNSASWSRIIGELMRRNILIILAQGRCYSSIRAKSR